MISNVASHLARFNNADHHSSYSSSFYDTQSNDADFNEAIRLNPNHASAYYNRGLIKEERGEKQETLADFRRASELYQQQGNTEWHNNSRDRIKELGD